MRIGINASFLGKRYNGIARFTDRLVECLQIAGHDLVIYTSSNTLPAGPRVSLRQTPESLTTDAGPRASFRRFGWMQTVLPSRLRADKVDLLMCPSVEGLLTSNVPQVLTVHDLIPLFYQEENPIQHHYYKHVLPRLVRKARFVIAVSRHTKEDVVRVFGLPPEKVRVATSGVELELHPDKLPQPEEDRRYFLYVGTYSPRKNFETVLRAYAAIAPRVPEDLIVVAYPDRWQSSSLALARDLGILDRIVFKSGVPVEMLAALYRGATALVLLSEYEGFGFPPLEAMYLGTPAIVSDSTSLGEVTAGGAVQVPCKDVEGAAEAMLKISSDSEFRAKLSELGKAQAEKYSRGRCAIQLQNAIEPINDAIVADPLRVGT